MRTFPFESSWSSLFYLFLPLLLLALLVEADDDEEPFFGAMVVLAYEVEGI